LRRTLVVLAAAAALTGAAALPAAGQTVAAYTPKLVVQQQAAAETTIEVAVPSTDDPTAKLTFFAPAGTSASLSASAGSTIGTVDAEAAAGALGGATLPLTGSVQARAANGTYLSSGRQVSIATAGERCTGTVTHAAYWVLALGAAGQTLEVPLFVDPVPSSAPFAPLVSYSLAVCLPPPESFGVKLLEASFTVQGVFSAPSSGDNLWRLLATPYSPSEGTADADATVEAQSFVETATTTLGPPTRTLTRLAATFRAAGTVEIDGLSDTVAGLSLARGTTATRLAVVANPGLRADGTYSTHFSVRRAARRAQVLFLQAAAAAPPRDLVATACKATFDVPCVAATAGGFVTKSATRKVVVPALPRRA